MVIKKIAQIMKDVSGVKRDHTLATKKGSFQVRTEEEVLRIIRPEFLKHGLVVVPIKSRAFSVTQKDYALITTIDVDYRIYDSEDNDFIEVSATGQGNDGGDKGAGMALTYATKNLLLKLIMATAGDDPDKIPSPDESDHMAFYADSLIKRIENLPESYAEKKPAWIQRIRENFTNMEELKKAESFIKTL